MQNGVIYWVSSTEVCYIPDTPLSLTGISRGLFLGHMLIFKGDNTGWNSRPCSSSDGEATSAVSMSMMV